jgi:hypothetical protein
MRLVGLVNDDEKNKKSEIDKQKASRIRIYSATEIKMEMPARKTTREREREATRAL